MLAGAFASHPLALLASSRLPGLWVGDEARSTLQPFLCHSGLAPACHPRSEGALLGSGSNSLPIPCRPHCDRAAVGGEGRHMEEIPTETAAPGALLLSRPVVPWPLLGPQKKQRVLMKASECPFLSVSGWVGEGRSSKNLLSPLHAPNRKSGRKAAGNYCSLAPGPLGTSPRARHVLGRALPC